MLNIKSGKKIDVVKVKVNGKWEDAVGITIAAEMLGFSRQHVAHLTRKPKLEMIEVGKKKYVLLNSILSFRGKQNEKKD